MPWTRRQAFFWHGGSQDSRQVAFGNRVAIYTPRVCRQHIYSNPNTIKMKSATGSEKTYGRVCGTCTNPGAERGSNNTGIRPHPAASLRISKRSYTPRVSDFTKPLKGKDAMMIFDKPNNFENKNFWATGYYAGTQGLTKRQKPGIYKTKTRPD